MEVNKAEIAVINKINTSEQNTEKLEGMNNIRETTPKIINQHQPMQIKSIKIIDETINITENSKNHMNDQKKIKRKGNEHEENHSKKSKKQYSNKTLTISQGIIEEALEINTDIINTKKESPSITQSEEGILTQKHELKEGRSMLNKHNIEMKEKLSENKHNEEKEENKCKENNTTNEGAVQADGTAEDKQHDFEEEQICAISIKENEKVEELPVIKQANSNIPRQVTSYKVKAGKSISLQHKSEKPDTKSSHEDKETLGTNVSVTTKIRKSNRGKIRKEKHKSKQMSNEISEQEVTNRKEEIIVERTQKEQSHDEYKAELKMNNPPEYDINQIFNQIIHLKEEDTTFDSDEDQWFEKNFEEKEITYQRKKSKRNTFTSPDSNSTSEDEANDNVNNPIKSQTNQNTHNDFLKIRNKKKKYYLRIYTVPPMMTSEILQGLLVNYCEILQFSYIKDMKFGILLTSNNINVTFRMKEGMDISAMPGFITFNEIELMLRIKGLSNPCTICHVRGHPRTLCKNNYCKTCRRSVPKGHTCKLHQI